MSDPVSVRNGFSPRQTRRRRVRVQRSFAEEKPGSRSDRRRTGSVLEISSNSHLLQR